MNIRLLNSERGLTLVELVVTMGVCSILLVILISGTLFIQKYLNRWSQRGSLTEEIVFVRESLRKSIQPSQRVSIWADSLTARATNGKTTTYAWTDSLLTKDGVNLLRSGVRVHSLSIADFTLTEETNATILHESMGAGTSAYLRIHLVLGDERGLSDSLGFVLRNDYAYVKYNTRQTQPPAE